ADHYSWAQHVAHLWMFAAAAPPAPPPPRRRRIGVRYRQALREKALRGSEPVTPAETTVLLPVANVTAQPTGDAYKDEVQRQWDSDPAGAHYVRQAQPHTLEWFLEAERYRYRDYAPWMPATMEFEAHAGENVLEIGGGMGSDLAQFALHGATVTDL